MKPLFCWVGGKSKELKKIMQYVPEYTTYIEPFIGAGALFFHLNPDNAVINDIHSGIIALYREIAKGNADKVHSFASTIPNTREEFIRVKNMTCDNDLDVAKQFYYLRKNCFRGIQRYNKKGEDVSSWCNLTRSGAKINYSLIIKPEYTNLLGRTTILNNSFEKIFEQYNNENNFVFLDPPYDNGVMSNYFSPFGKDEHIKLAKLFKETKNKCLMIIGKTPFICNLYKDYIKCEYIKHYDIKTGKYSENNVLHLVITNYQIPEKSIQSRM